MVTLVFAVPASAQEGEPAPGSAPEDQSQTGGAQFGADPNPIAREIVPGAKAVLLSNGLAAAPADAPARVQEAIWRTNELQDKPYIYGGGHGDFEDDGYDCSGTISFALNAADLLRRPRDSSGFMCYGASGKGRWITIYTNPGHAYMVIAGLRLDTSSAGDRVNRGKGPRWRASGRPTRGFKVRHPVGF